MNLRPGICLLDREKVDDEDQRFVRRDLRREAFGAVSQIAGDYQLAPAPDLHPFDAPFPTLQRFAGAEGEGIRLRPQEESTSRSLS